MLFRSLVALGSLLFPCAFAHATPAVGAVTRFSLTAQTQVPGRTLQPGSYGISVIDHLSDRLILRVEGPGVKADTFIGLSSPAASMPAGPVLLNAGASAAAALRGFSFSDGTFAEFVYPKGEAVALAKANNASIPAIDPASEGKPETISSLSHSDMQLVTLWVLTPTKVGPDAKPGIEAARYKAPAEQASNDTPAPPPARAAKRKPVIAALPHTASNLPALWMAGLFSLAAAGILTRRRFITSGV